MNLEGVLVEDQKKDTLLYAGNFQVNITDWFFFRDKVVLKYIGLKDAVVYFNRSDSVWNYQFLANYFGSTDTSQKKESGLQVNLKRLVLDNVRFVKKDAWAGNNLEAYVSTMDMDVDTLSITNKKLIVARAVFKRAYFAILDYTGRAPALVLAKTASDLKDSTAGWNISFKDIHLSEGRLRVDKQNLVANSAGFDGDHLDFTKINGTLKNIGLVSDSIRGTIDLSAQERSGLVIRSLKAVTTIHPKAMIFDDFFLQTNHSSIGNYFAMHYDNIDSLGNFIHNVSLETNFNKATISSDDIAYFAPEVKSWKKNIKIQGRVRGTVDALSSKDLEVWAGNHTYIHGAVSLVGLPDIRETLINIDAKELNTTYADAVSFIPSIRNIDKPDLKKLSFIRFKGSYTGFFNDFVTLGTLQTNLGNLETDLNMKFPANDIPVYSGTVSTAGFQLGQFLSSPDLGLVDFHGNIKGHGFQWKNLDINIDGIIHHIQYGNYTYQFITAKCNLSHRLFNGDFQIKDPNADLHLSGLIDLSSVKPKFDVKANIVHANLQALQLTTENMELNGDFNLNLEASSISDMVGSARITNATLLNNGKKLSFDSLSVTSDYTNGLKVFRAQSNEFNVILTGDFNVASLPEAFTLILNRYYPAYIKAPVNVKPQTFTYDITTGIVEDYIKLADSRLGGFNNSHISGSINLASNTITVDADIPQFSFKNNIFTEVKLKGSGDRKKLVFTGQSVNTQIGDSILFPQTNFSVTAQNDSSEITVNTSANQAINHASLSALVRTFNDGVSILFRPSSFTLNGKTWSVEPGGALNFRRNTILDGQVVLKESNQEVKLWTELSSIGNWNDLHVSMRNINIGDLSPLLVRTNRFEGILTGDAVIEDPQEKFNLTANLYTDELRVDNDSIGRMNASVNYNNKTGSLTGKGNNVNPDHHLAFDLALNLKDSALALNNRISIQPTNFELKYLDRFLNNIFSDIHGYMTGNLDILGSGDNQQFIGKAKLTDASLKIKFTQVTYKIDNTEIELKKDSIDLRNKNITLRDHEGNTALVDGYIAHHAFQNMFYDISVRTESKHMELINTTYKDNQEFFGKARGSGSFVLQGPQNDLYMNIEARASDTDSSFITLPPSRNRESGQASFMVEKKYGHEMTANDLEGLTDNLKYDVHLDANPMVNIQVILDELTGDVIKARGTGDIRMSSGTSSPLTINGRYDIYEGSYLFTFQSFLKKPFTLKRGANNYIQWDGDPYGATVHLEAVYTAEKVSFAPLASTLITNSNLLHFRDDVNVVATLTGNLFHPVFKFRLEFPSNNILYSDPSIAFGLQQIEKNQNELNKQVTYLIVFNSFTPYENSTATGFNPFEEFTYNTISGLFFGEINKRLNQLLSKILRNNNLTLNFTGSLYNRDLVNANSRGVFNINQSNLNLSVGKSLFNDRASFTVGGTFDVPLQSDFQTNIRLFPDVTLQLILNKTGSVRATFFYREDVDYMLGIVNNGNLSTRRYGTSLTYGREFNTLGELFSRKNKKPKTETIPKVVDSTGTK